MNKTISINLGGWFFHVEENGYRQLDRYLNAIQNYFAAEAGCTEIVEDIEMRIAEMLQEILTKQKRQVVINTDIQDVIGIMGMPEQFDNDLSEADKSSVENTITPIVTAQSTTTLQKLNPTNQEQSEQTTAQTTHRRLYRNPDDKFISGVCSGLAAYMGIEDPTWLRLALVTMVVMSVGSIIPAYIILMIVVPEAQTTAQKLAMKGEPINLSNIEKTLKDGVDNLQNSLNDFNQSEQGAKVRRFFNRIGNGLETTIPKLFRSLSPLLRLAAIGIAIAFVLGFVGMLIGWVVSIFGALKFLSQFIFNGLLPTLTFALSGMVAIGVPIVFLLYFILRRTFRINGAAIRQWGGALGLLWLLSIASMSFTGARAYTTGFDADSYIEKTLPIALNDQQKVLNLEAIDKQDLSIIRDNNANNMPFNINDDAFDFENSTYYGTEIELDIARSNSGQFELYEKIESNGGSENEAKANAQEVRYDINQEANTLQLSNYFTAKNTKWRNQTIDLTLKVPVGKAIYLNPNIRDIIYDIKNVTDTYDGDMVGHTWIMTERGLALADANLQPIFDEDEVNQILSNSSHNKETSSNSQLQPEPPLPPAPPTLNEENAQAGEENLDNNQYKGFTSIEINDALEVEIVQSATYFVKTKGNADELALVKIQQNGEELILNQKKGEAPTLRLYIGMPHLARISLNNAAHASISGFEEKNVAIILGDATQLDGDINAEQLDITIKGAANAKLSGKADQLNAIIKGAASLDADKLAVENADMELNDSANADIWVSQQLNSELNDASQLNYKGNTRNVKNETNGAAKINKVD
jgi:phage shock protein PspC (stress-responsive transcriptional regulator)